jgi:hypothetical protein
MSEKMFNQMDAVIEALKAAYIECLEAPTDSLILAALISAEELQELMIEARDSHRLKMLKAA